MSDGNEKEQLLARLAEIEDAALGTEAAQLKARLYEIGSQAAGIVVTLNDGPTKNAEELARTAANYAEEAAQHGIRLTQILTSA